MRVGISGWRAWHGWIGLLVVTAIGCGQADEAGRAPDRGENAIQVADGMSTEKAIGDVQSRPEDEGDGEVEADRTLMELDAPDRDAQSSQEKWEEPRESASAPDSNVQADDSRRPSMARQSPAMKSVAPMPTHANARAPDRSVTSTAESNTEPAAISSTAEDTSSQQVEEDAPYDMVTVFYATDRQKIDGAVDTPPFQLWVIAIGMVAVIGFVWFVFRVVRITRPVKIFLALIPVLGISGLVGLQGMYWFAPEQAPITKPDAQYGNRRGQMDRGICRVSIPWSHRVGRVESPSILRLEVREDVRKHVVVHAINPQPEDEFFQQLRRRVESAERPDVFVFVHGYNVTFKQAARRTAQIAYDVKFQGAPVFFSWPSQGGLFRYTVDETNVTWAVPHLKQFLLNIVRRSGAQSVNLIAHSMGNRALTQAVRELHWELRDESALFNQIILAAPDVDAEIFRRDLAPALTQTANRVTMYASSKDQALIASKQVHGYARAGDTGDGLVVVSGVDTIDVSTIATSLLGHSYYGSSNPVLSDIYSLIHEALPASQRRWLRPRTQGKFTYWVLEKIRETTSGPES